MSCHLIKLLKETDETKSESTDDDGTNMLAAETEREESVFTDFPEMSQTQDIVEVRTLVEDVREMYEEEETNLVIFDFTEEPLFRGNAYFGSVRTEIAVNSEFNLHFLGVIKQYDANYPKEDIVRTLEGKPAGTKIVLTATIRGVRLVAIGYKVILFAYLCLKGPSRLWTTPVDHVRKNFSTSTGMYVYISLVRQMCLMSTTCTVERSMIITVDVKATYD